MVGNTTSRTGTARRLLLGSLFFTLVVLGLVALTSLHSPGVARGTSEAVGYYGGTPTPVSTAIGTHLPPVQLGADVVAQGQTETVIVHTAPRTHVTYNVTYTGSASRVHGTGVANASGLLSFSFKIVPGPSAGAAPLTGTLTVQSTTSGVQLDVTTTFQVYPALHLATQIHSVTAKKVTTLVVQVQLAARAKVTASVMLPGGPKPAATAHGAFGGKQPLVLNLKLGTLHGHTVVTLTVTIVTINGVQDTKTFQVIAQQ